MRRRQTTSSPPAPPTSMEHTLEELGERADTISQGHVCIWQSYDENRGVRSPESKHWGARFGENDRHYGATPGEAVDKALKAQEGEHHR